MNSGARLQTRGPVQEEALYIERAADQEIESVMRKGGLVLLLGPPGGGKSSLRIRIGRLLAKEGLHGAHLPLGKLPSATPAAFCLGFMQGLGRALNLPPLNAFFQRYAEEYGDTEPSQRLEVFLREMVLGQAAGPSGHVALFFDDLDQLDKASAAALCSALYGLFTAAEEGAPPPELPLGVCLTSTTEIEELDLALPSHTFRIYLPPFSRDEIEVFTPALSPFLGDRPAEPLLDAVHEWTGGQPYLVQHLCQQLVLRGSKDKDKGDELETPEQIVESLVEKLFPQSELADDPVLSAMEKRLLGDQRSASLLGLWRRVWRGEAVHVDPGDALQRALYLCGLVPLPEAPHGDGDSRVRPGGRIVGRVFDDEWARTQEARQLLRAAVAEGEASKLRGAALKTAQTWAARHAEALSATEVRALLICLEAARQEAEARHQSSAAALQRETRERSDQRAQWQREREELVAAAEQAKWRGRGLIGLCVLLFAVALLMTYVALSKRSKSSPQSQMSPAPSVMNRSPAASSLSARAAMSARRATWVAPECPAARIFSTRAADETPAIGASPAA